MRAIRAMNDVRLCDVLEAYRKLARVRGVEYVAGMMRNAGYPLTYARTLAAQGAVTPATLRSMGAR